jgi:hypothetical protein
MAFGEANFVIRAINKTQKTFTQIGQGVDKMDRRFGKFGNSLNKIGGLMATAFVGKQITDTITKFEKLEASLRTVAGGADNAKIAFSFIQEFAATTPFQLEEVTGAFIKLKALGLNPSEKSLTSYGNTAVAMGKSLNQMIEAVADAATGEFERLKEFGIKARTQGDQVTFTFQGVKTTVNKNAAEIEGYLKSIGEVQFAGAMEEQADTLNVSLSNMGDAFSKLVKAIGDAGLTDILQGVADGVKWLAEKITSMIKPMELGFKSMISIVMQFANNFLAVFKGIGRGFTEFINNFTGRFEAFGRDLANFVNDPLNSLSSGIDFSNTQKALETGLSESLRAGFQSALDEARQFNESLDAEINSLANNIYAEQNNKVKSLSSLFEETATSEGAEKTAEQLKTFNKLQQEAQSIINATRTPLEAYNLEMDRLNMLLQQGHINQETFGRALDQAQEKFTTASKKSKNIVQNEFDSLGLSIQNKFINSLDLVGGKFEGFGDLAKNILADVSRSLMNLAFSGLSGGGGVAELATDAEAIAKSDSLRALTPKNLAAIQASTSMPGLIEIATNQETINGSDASLAVSPVGLKTALESYGDKDVQVFTESGNWTKPAGISRVRVLLVGAGGSGAGTGGNCGARSGGAGGGFAEAVIDVSSLSSVAITVGTGGPAEADTTCATGTDGGDSSFGSFVTAHGGQGGFNGTAQGGTITYSSSSSIIAVTGRKGGDATYTTSGAQKKFGAASGWNDNELWQNYNGDGDNFGAWRDDGRDAVHVGSGGTAGSNYYYHERTTGAGADGIVIVEPIG